MVSHGIINYKVKGDDTMTMTNSELKKLLVNYVDLLNRYEKQGNKRAIIKVKQSINYIKKQLGDDKHGKNITI